MNIKVKNLLELLRLISRWSQLDKVINRTNNEYATLESYILYHDNEISNAPNVCENNNISFLNKQMQLSFILVYRKDVIQF